MSNKASNILNTGGVSNDLIKEAEIHAELQILKLKQEKSDRRKRLIKFGSMTLLTALVLVLTTVHMPIKQMTAETA